jgi:hypothetical protein
MCRSNQGAGEEVGIMREKPRRRNGVLAVLALASIARLGCAFPGPRIVFVDPSLTHTTSAMDASWSRTTKKAGKGSSKVNKPFPREKKFA